MKELGEDIPPNPWVLIRVRASPTGLSRFPSTTRSGSCREHHAAVRMECAPSPLDSGQGQLPRFSPTRQLLTVSGPAGARAGRPAVDPLQAAPQRSLFVILTWCTVLPHHPPSSWQHPIPFPTLPHLLFLDGASPLPLCPWGHRVVGRGLCRSPLE